MQGQSNHQILQRIGAKFLGMAQIHAEFKPTKYPFPAIVERGSGLVKGEIYSLTDEAIDVLDHFEGHPEFYQRRTVFTTDGLLVEVFFGTGVINVPKSETTATKSLPER